MGERNGEGERIEMKPYDGPLTSEMVQETVESIRAHAIPCGNQVVAKMKFTQKEKDTFDRTLINVLNDEILPEVGDYWILKSD